MLKSKLQTATNLIRKFVRPFHNPLQFVWVLPQYFIYFRELYLYQKQKEAEPFKIADLTPMLFENTSNQTIDKIYFYQDIWAFRKIQQSGTLHHVDVGSKLDLIGFLSAITKIIYVDIRPLNLDLENYESKEGSILALPFEDNSVVSLSCLHVVEHIGLGRYGDPIDPLGTLKACKELSRVLVPGGSLFFSTPIGKSKLCFNAHRIHTVAQILSYFQELKLVELSGIDDRQNFKQNVDGHALSQAHYACGLFHFTKESKP